MKIIQTFYNQKETNLLDHTFGWYASEYHLMSWALSCLQLRKYYGDVSLYSNSQSAEVLVDILKLPYTSVYSSHDNFEMPHENLWALPKIYTYSLQATPFLHVDGDVFIFDAFQKPLLSGELIAQNVEEATEFYTSTQKGLIENFNYFPKFLKDDFEKPVPIKAINAGILGGSNFDFFKNYCIEAFEYVHRNIDKLSKVNVSGFNVFFEQHLFYVLAKEKNVPIELLFSDIKKDNEYQFLSEFEETPCVKKYLHLLGDYKRDEYTCRQMAAKLRQLYPDYYFKILELFKNKNNTYFSKRYGPFQFTNSTEFKLFNDGVKIEYKKENNEDFADENKPYPGIEADQIPDLVFLRDFVKKVESTVEIVKDININDLCDDFDLFSKKVAAFLNHRFSNGYLYGRDLEAVSWHCNLFADEEKIKDRQIVCCKEICIIESKYNWAGILCKHKRVSIPYYRELELAAGEYFNLIIPEVTEYGMAAFDIEGIDHAILEKLRIPISIESLISALEIYFEDDVIINHHAFYEQLILRLVKELVSKKAIRPIFMVNKE